MRKLPLLFFCALFLSCAKEPLLSKAKSGDEAYQECHRLTVKKKHEEAIQCFELLKGRFAGTRASYQADLEIGDNYYRQGEYLLAIEAYRAFARLHPTHEKIPYAHYRIGLSYLKESPKAFDRDQQYLDDAMHYLELATSDPSGKVGDVAREKWREARTKIARRHFYVGRFYHKKGEYLSAIPRFQEIVTNYTGLGLDTKALYLLGDSYMSLSEKERALEILSVLEKHFPESPFRKKLSRRIGVH